ncbi:MAG: thiol peroxidase [Bacteroidaceae bacterium]
MNTRKDLKITFAGGPVTILGDKLSVGDVAPDFSVLNGKLQPVKLSDFAGKQVVIAVYPSVDTSVCAAQNRRFNSEVNNMKDTVVLSISCDLPFAQSRFCAAEGLDNILTLSDHRDLDFGSKYGFVIKELRLLTRGTVIIGADGKIKYIEYVEEVTKEPDYEKAMAVVQG